MGQFTGGMYFRSWLRSVVHRVFNARHRIKMIMKFHCWATCHWWRQLICPGCPDAPNFLLFDHGHPKFFMHVSGFAWLFSSVQLVMMEDVQWKAFKAVRTVIYSASMMTQLASEMLLFSMFCYYSHELEQYFQASMKPEIFSR